MDAVQQAGHPTYGRRRETGCERAAELSRQILAYSGEGRFFVEPLDFSALIAGMAQELESSIGEEVELSYTLTDELPAVTADATQIRQLVMNLVRLNQFQQEGRCTGMRLNQFQQKGRWTRMRLNSFQQEGRCTRMRFNPFQQEGRWTGMRSKPFQ